MDPLQSAPEGRDTGGDAIERTESENLTGENEGSTLRSSATAPSSTGPRTEMERERELNLRRQPDIQETETVNEPSGCQPTELCDSSFVILEEIEVSGMSSNASEEIDAQKTEALKTKGNTQRKEHSSSDVESDSEYQETYEHLNNENKEDPDDKHHQSAVDPEHHDMITLNMYTVLRKGVNFDYPDTLHLVTHHGEKISMKFVKTYEDVGHVFHCQMPVGRQWANMLTYRYCLTSNITQTDRYENVGDGLMSSLTGQYYRKLFRDILNTEDVFYQFDDICMRGGILSKSTVISKVRRKFLQASFLYLMDCCNFADFPALKYILLHLHICAQRRLTCCNQQIKEIKPLMTDKCTKALQKAVMMLKQQSPIQKVLVTSVIADFFKLDLDRNTIDLISNIVKVNGDLKGTLTDIDNSSRYFITEALRYVVDLACKLNSPKGAMWITALFYAVRPSDYRNDLDINQHYVSWDSVQWDLGEVVDSYSIMTSHQTIFTHTLLEMFSPAHGDPRVLSKLNISPLELLQYLLKWTKSRMFHTLDKVIQVIVPEIKSWLASSFQENLTNTTVTQDTFSCFMLVNDILKSSDKLQSSNWTNHMENVYSSLQLLGSFCGYLDCLHGDKDFETVSNCDIPKIRHKMEECVKNELLGKRLHVEEWTKLFELRLPSIWQMDWENVLARLFSRKLQKERDTDQVVLFTKSSSCPETMKKCFSECASQSVKRLFKKNGTVTEELSDLLDKVSNNGKVMSLIIENILGNQQWDTTDYDWILYDQQVMKLFKTMECQGQPFANYKDRLSPTAGSLITRAKTFLKQLPEHITNKSIPCKQMSFIIDRKQEDNTYFLIMGRTEHFLKALNEAEEDFKGFTKRQQKVKALATICSSLPVDTKPVGSFMKIKLAKDVRSLKDVLDSTPCVTIHIFGKIDVLSESTYFKEIWKRTGEAVKNSEFNNVDKIPLDQVHEKIFKPALAEFKTSFRQLQDLSMSLNDLDEKLGKFIKRDAHVKELKVMENVFSEESKPNWIEKTCDHIQRYKELESVVEVAEVVSDLKDNLGLQGNFSDIGNLQRKGDTHLRDLTSEVYKSGQTMKKFNPNVIIFLKELNTCVKNGFISWIKGIIKDTGELSAFVELASISAGENTMDIDKVCYFRDAISAAAPIIYGLSKESGFTDFSKAVLDVKSALISDKKLTVKLEDSCKNKDWLQIAYETHGSVERSSLRQAKDINESGIYTIRRPEGQAMVSLESCITLRCRDVDGKVGHRQYSLTDLKELQNKLMLITVTADNKEDDISTYVEVLEHIINVGVSFLELCDAGHILFKDWEMKAYCEHEHDPKIWVNFGITNVEIKGQRPLLEELKGLSESMRCCLSEWRKYVELKRNKYHSLNHFTAKQLVNLCCSMAEVQHQDKISASLLNMLSIMKEDISDEDVHDALTKALQTPVEDSGTQGSAQLKKFLNDYPEDIEYFTGFGFTDKVIKAAIIYCEQQEQEGGRGSENIDDSRDIVMECITSHQHDEDWVQQWCESYESTRDTVHDSQLKFKGGHSSDQIALFAMTQDEISAMFENLNCSDEKIVMLWKTYHNKLSGLVSDKFVDLDVLGESMQHVSNSTTKTVHRKLPFGLEAGKPNLMCCKDVDMASLCLSVYKDEEQPLPSYDEILICTPETTAEEVELILRRALQSGSIHEKIYSLLNADKLNHEVSRKLESTFYKLSKTQNTSATENYRLIIYCDSKANHSYVATAFENYKRTFPEHPNRNEEIKQYLKSQHKIPCGTEEGFAKLHQFQQFSQRIKFVFSEHAGMGKSLYVKRLVNASMKELKGEGFTHKTIRLSESHLRPEHVIQQFQSFEDKPTDVVPRIFHFDVPPVVSKGLYSFLLQLFVLRCFQSPDGSMWRCNNSHVYLVEYTRRTSRECDRHNSEISTKMEEALLEMFPNVKCLSPEETQKYLSEGESPDEEYQLMDEAEFSSEAFQRTYQYFKRYELNQLKTFSFLKDPEKAESFSCEDTPKEWLQCLMRYCNNRTPSWGELRNFTHFLNMQLKKCEQSIFCSEDLSEDLTGFKKFVVKFMITMSKDFSIRSLEISDESDEKEMNPNEEDADLNEFQLRRHWEQATHPYIIFNADNTSMTFLGFHIHNQDAIDSRTGKIVEEKVIDRVLFNQLRAQKVPFNVDFEALPRKDQLDIISRVLGVTNVTDPDDTYQLTHDNVMKILAIHLRFESDIPVIIMGETGCGKTRLVQFMCDLLRSGKKGKNMIVVRVHGGTTSEIIYKKVQEAVKISKRNETEGMDTILFFDEANTTEAVNAIKEVICDKSVNGEPIDARRLKIIAACNPYRKHSEEAIQQLEKAGLGYRVKSENTEEKLGRIPMRQLVYRVQPLPPSLSPLVWDFGKLNEKTQQLYIHQMVKTFFQKEDLPKQHESLFTKVISVSQMHMAGLTDECRMVSLRDIERCMKTVMWFYQRKDKLFAEIDKHGSNGNVNALVRSLILAVGVCYMASLENRDAYLKMVAPAFSLPLNVISTEIESCKKVFIDHVDCPGSVAKNDALKENVFMMVVCMNLRIPLFLVGKPGSSKSLSKTIAAHAMQGKSSQSELFRGFKQAQLASFQCSPHSSPDGIISVFRQCAQFQKDKNLKEYVSVVVLDEIGLAEDSPKMPLKTLHPLLEFGCIDDEQPKDFKKVAFIGISNWSLDPAKMNRGVLVLRSSPITEELQYTARAICTHKEEHIFTEIVFLIPLLTEFYQSVLQEQEQFSDFFGLRDFYSLVKLIVSYAVKTNGKPSNEDLTKAVQRNFGGFDSIDILQIFWDVFNQETNKCDTISLLRENLSVESNLEKEPGTSGFTSRYLLLPTTNHAALQILKFQGIIREDNAEVIFGSGFPHDEEYSQVCRTVNRVKTCMETGRTVILLNIQSLYESLYDALNQCYVKLGGSYYVDLGLGSHRVKCRVKDEFRLIVIEEKSTVYEQFPTPLLNRLEKHCLEISNILPPHAKEMQNELENWLKTFVTTDMYQSEEATDILRKKHDSIVGYTEDTCASVLLQCCPDILSQEFVGAEREEIIGKAKEKLIQCATPDSVLRASSHLLVDPDNLLETYFMKQPHGNMMKTLKTYRDEDPKGLNIEISTFSRLLNKKDLEQINNQLSIGEDDSCLYLLNEFYTEQSFSQILKDFLTKGTSRARKVVLLQSYFECPKQSQRLLFCVRHSITQLRTMMNEGIAFDIVLITRLPRISGGCGYIASFGDNWRSLHLDELTPTPGFPGDIYELQRMAVSEILKQSSYSSHVEDSDQLLKGTLKEQVILVDTVFLLKKSLQKGILQLQDKVDNTERATKRIEILHGLLHNKYDVSKDFIKTLEGRIISLLSAQERKENWVITQALSEHFVAEGGSFRHMLWVHLEDTVACALAQILAVIDGDNNLDNLINDQFPEMAELWLKIFQGDQWDLLNIPVTHSHRKVCVVSNTRNTDQSRTCIFPFGWVLKERLQCLWSNVINLIHQSGPSDLPSLEYLDKLEELIPLDWVKDIKGNSKLFAQFSEDLVNMTMTAYPHDLNKSFSDTLLKLTPCLYHKLTEKDPENVSLPWLFVAYQYMQDNHQHFYNLYLQNNDLVNAGEATEALRKTIESLQPKEKVLENLAGCQDWLKKVKSLSMTVEVMLSENSLVTRFRENGMLLITEIRLFWQSTRIMYLLLDHLLESETDMEKKLLTLLVRNLVWMWKKLNTDDGNNMEYVIEKVTSTLTLCGNNACNIFMVKCAYCEKEFTEDDTAKVECGHMFHLSCLRDHSDTKCRKCKKDISTDYKPCGVLDKETFLKVIRFRRKCNSFFVEFMWNFVPTKAQLTNKIVEDLINYVRGSPSEEAKNSEKFTLKECLKPDRNTHSLVLKILLRCGMEESAAQLQRFLDAALCSCKDNTEELYFMIVRSIEDHIHSSNQRSLIQKAQDCLNTSKFSTTEPDVITAGDLHTIAKFRFAISVASDAMHSVLTEDEQAAKGNEQLLQSLQMLISDSANPWIQIYVLRNLYKMYGSSIIHHLGDRFKWAIPCESFTDQDLQMDPFLMYGDLYERTMLDSMLDDSSQQITEDESLEFFPVCMALGAVKQATLNRMLQGNKVSLIEKMKVEPSTDVNWGELVGICEKVTEGALEELSPGLSQIVLHTAVVVHQSQVPEVELLRTLCFRPGNAKDFFLPTMPSSVYEIMNWIKPTVMDSNVIWRCQCGEPVVIGNCGKPVETKKCVNCHQDVGGVGYNVPAEGFEKIEIAQGSGKGHNLSDPDSRRDQEGERNLFGAHLLLVRALIHSSLIWATVDHLEEIQNIVRFKSITVRTYLHLQLQKDIDLLANSLGKSSADAEIAVHFFLKYIMETKSDTDTRILTTETEEKRLKWETSIHQKLQTFFMDFEDRFSSVHSNILRKAGMEKLAQIVYSTVPELKDLPITGVFNLPLMWKYEQKMTIQLLSRLIEQKDERKNVPVLTELLKNSVHIRYIRYLPQVLSLQHKLMYHFRNVDLQCYENVPIKTFIKERETFLNNDDEVKIFKKNVEILKTIWGHLTTIEYLRIPMVMKDKKKEDLMILDFLPREDSVIYIVTDYLVRMQNDCINCANPKENRLISTSEVKPSHVIDCTPEQDFLTIAMSNIDHVVCEDGTESSNYNFKTLERQIVDRFFTEKPIIKVTTIPLFEYNTGTTLRAFFRKEELKEKLEPLNTNDRNSILNDFRFLNEISAALSTLKIAIGFMQLSFPPAEEYLVNYLKKDLKLEDRTHTLSLPVLRTSRVKHIQSLWEVLSLRQSSLLIEMNQNPFFMIKSDFHAPISEDQRKEITPKLANLTKMDLFITDLHYVIMNIHFRDVPLDWSIQETFGAFVDYDEIDENVLEIVESLPNLMMKNSIALWKMAVKMKRGLSG